MALSQGTRLGPYEILGSFGAGGQGEVYRALDTRLDRTVAIKSIKGGLGENPGRRARVEREARILAQLSHPNICALYDIVQQDGQTYLVMEALEGQTLAARLRARGKRGLPVPECLAITAAAADGLAFAHQHDVVHQDVKPGNIMLTPSGVKLLDFGIARLRRAGQDTDVTLTAPVGESSGEGTLPYMAPEQLRGEVDPRSDLFALGAVLYEMLTGTRPFVADSPTALATRISEHDPPPLPTEIAPPAIARAIKKCLAKDPAHRWQTATDLADELRWLAANRDHANLDQAGAPAHHGPRRHAALLGVAGTIALASVAALWVELPNDDSRAGAAVAFKLYAPPTTSLMGFGGSPLAFSPDGRQLAFVALKNDGTDALFVRSLDQLDARELNGTSGAAFPFWSPDGRQVAFTQSGVLKRVTVADQVSSVIAAGARGQGSWGPGGVILVAHAGRIKRVTVGDGSIADVELTIDPSAVLEAPAFLPDGKHFLYWQRGVERAGVYVSALSNPTPAFVIAADSGAIPSRDHLLFVRGRDLLAIAFDPRRLVTVGDPKIVLTGVARFSYSCVFTVADSGAAAAIVGSTDSRRLAWFTLSGERIADVPGSEGYRNPVLTRDGSRLAAERAGEHDHFTSLWVVNLERGIGSQVTDASADHSNPVWSPDGRRLAFNGNSLNAAAIVDLTTQQVLTLDAPETPAAGGRRQLGARLDPRRSVVAGAAPERARQLGFVARPGGRFDGKAAGQYGGHRVRWPVLARRALAGLHVEPLGTMGNLSAVDGLEQNAHPRLRQRRPRSPVAPGRPCDLLRRTGQHVDGR